MKLKTKRRRKRTDAVLLKVRRKKRLPQPSEPSEELISTSASKAKVKAILDRREKKEYELPPIIIGECPICGKHKTLNVLMRPMQVCWDCGSLPYRKLKAILMAKGWWPPAKYAEDFS